MNPQIDLHIDELILRGFSPHQRYAIAQAVEMELTRLFTENRMPVALQQGGRVPSINAGSFTMSKENNSESIGSKIANTVYTSFGHEPNKISK